MQQDTSKLPNTSQKSTLLNGHTITKIVALVIFLVIIFFALTDSNFLQTTTTVKTPPSTSTQKKAAITPNLKPTFSVVTKALNVQTVDTSDWKTYTAPKLGISFKYPKTWYTHAPDRYGYQTVISYPVNSNSMQSWTEGQKLGIEITTRLNEGKSVYTQALSITNDPLQALLKPYIQQSMIGTKKTAILFSKDNHTIFMFVNHSNISYIINAATPQDSGKNIQQFMPDIVTLVSTITFIPVPKNQRLCGGKQIYLPENQCDFGYSCVIPNYGGTGSHYPAGSCVKTDVIPQQ